jgi:hypothetical protein
MKAAGLLLLGGIVAVTYWASQVQAMPQFKKAFQEKYVDKSDNPAFKAAVKKASCFVCHVKGEEKTVRNDYGKALSKFTGGTVNKDLKAAYEAGGDAAKDAKLAAVLKVLDDAFDKVAAQKSPSGKTYGDLIKDGKLPASK